jgi:uncharacterized membrane protein YbaN (DUF454 family)
MPPGAKVRAMLLIVITFSVSIYLVNLLWVRIMLGVMLCLLLLFMWRIPVVAASSEPHEP